MSLVDRAGRWLARQLWKRLGIVHDPSIYRCRGCGCPCKRRKDWQSIGEIARLCGNCFNDPKFAADQARAIKGVR